MPAIWREGSIAPPDGAPIEVGRAALMGCGRHGEPAQSSFISAIFLLPRVPERAKIPGPGDASRPRNSLLRNIMPLLDYSDPNSFVYRLRRRRSQHLRAIIERVTARAGECRIIDVGGEDRYWLNIFGIDWLRQHHVRIVLLNHTDEYVGHAPDPSIFSVVIADGCALPYEDGSFDLAHSNSVIEHLGEWTRQCRFAAEIRRVARQFYVQTPARCFPIEAHTRFPWFQYLPGTARIWLFQHVPMGAYPRVSAERARDFHNELRLLSRRQIARLFPDATIRREQLFGLTKSYMAVSQPA
jgi:hypothetical protein